VDDGRLSLDNNPCERQIPDIALGRKNYLFAGSHEAARRTATLYILLRTCARWGADPLAYPSDILPKPLIGWSQGRLHELLPPGRWQPVPTAL
jgi:transposase